MKKKTTDAQINQLLDNIKERLDSLEETIAWTIKANARFKKGQRVKFSKYAKRKHIDTGKAKGKKGTITEISDSFSVKVLLDGYKQPHQYHHSFFERVSR
jgi:hypothetical protein